MVEVALLVLVLVVAGMLRASSVWVMRIARADALRAAAEGRRGAEQVARLLERRDEIVPAVNVTHLALVVVAAVLGTWEVVRAETGVPVLLASTSVALIVLLMADLLPRAAGRRRSLELGYRLWWLVGAAVTAGSFATEFVVDEEDDEEVGVGPEDERQRKLIDAVIEFGETVVREVMVPRPDIVHLDPEDTIGSALASFHRHGFSRMPVIRRDDDDVVGLVILKDLHPALASGSTDDPVAPLVRPVQLVPDTLRAADLLRTMQASKSHLAMAVDEFGSISGLVTIEDLLEELVGEIADEYDEDELLVEEREDGSLLVDGRLAVSDLSEIIGAELPDDEWETVAGLVLDLAGRVPEEAEQFEAGPILFTVARVQGRRVGTVLVERRRSTSASETR